MKSSDAKSVAAFTPSRSRPWGVCPRSGHLEFALWFKTRRIAENYGKEHYSKENIYFTVRAHFP